ncbi:chondroitin sulfate proteoglycan 4 [Pseudophryne corroboree]|uniref:chondroitin sulfate proteoglycan 4 n=1 Tax=Pseudophryne corroboree TaxID=495146 RepID=UPI003081ED53
MMAGGHCLLLLLLLLGGVLQDMGSEGQHNPRKPDLQRRVDSSLHMTFVSSQSSGLLFFATGNTQYLLLELVNGTVRARLERGSGESILNSPTSMFLKSSETHTLDLMVTESLMSLTLDNFTSIMDLPWPPQKLYIQNAIFLGGNGGNSIPYHLQGIPNFHGCMLEAKFNNMDLLSGNLPQVEFHGNWENCHLENLSNSALSFGFLGPRSYLKFPSWDIRTHGSIQMTLETSRPGRAPLIYQPGPHRSYLYVEISGGHLQGTLDTGVSAVKIQNLVYISDSQPHTVHISVDNSKMQLIVDETSSQVSLDSLRQKSDFLGDLYIGGVDHITLAKMREDPLGSMFIDDMEYKSFSGCITDLKINKKKMGIWDALVIQDVTDGCHQYDDYAEYEGDTSSVLPTTTTRPTVFRSLSDTCKMEPSNPTFLLNPKPLPVTRGGSSVLELKYVHPTIDLAKAGIRKSQIVFTVVGDTQHGQLELDIPGAEARRKFTLLDVSNHRVRYVHDGSESHEDQLMLEVSLASDINVPECLRKAHRYNLTINISPLTAIPVIEFPKGNALGILSHGWLVFTMDIIKITDSDTPCDLLTIFVTGNSREGHVQFQHKPGESISEFSCRDLEKGAVAFIHKSGQQAQITLQASDGTSRSTPEHVIFIVLEPQMNITQKALVVSQGASALLSPLNLPTVTNTDKLGIEVIYQLVEHPRLGVIQRLVSGDNWKVTEEFRQSDLERAGVRYLSTIAELSEEEVTEDLKIQLKLETQVVSNNTFRVKVKRSSVQMMRMISLKLGRKRKVNLTENQLQVDTEIQGQELASYKYLISQSPRKGNLLFDGQRLMEGSRFTQEDLGKERISYAATVQNTKDMEDQFQFQVLYGTKNSPVYTYKILIGVDPDAPQLINQLLHVLEGGEEVITPEHLFLKSGRSASFTYEVIDGPQHGILIRKGNPQSGDFTEEGITEFTNEDILEGLLFYQHDGSETTEDDIPFVASRQQEGSASDISGEGEDDEQEVVRGVFRVSIQPVNDNPPLQIVHKVFTVVRDGQKLLTTNDIAFLDPDSGSTDSQIVLVRYGVPFGKIVFLDDPSLVVMRFTQEDIRRNRILFIHSGPDLGYLQLRVSDGLHHLTTILEVQASDPFIHIANITTLNVLSGDKGTLTATNLKLETNLDLRTEEDIKYYINTKPRWGEVLKDGNPTDSFSQQDLTDGLIVYQHSGEGINRDHFRISVEANQVVAVGDIKVQIISNSPPVTLNVIHNEKVYVFQGEAAEIKKDYLMVSAEGLFPHKIAYSLTDPPSFGYLVSISGELSSDGSPSLDSVHTFTQEDINKGRILYLHSASEMLPDRMTLEVSAEGTTQEIVIPLEILSVLIPLEANELEVEEGETTVLSSSILKVPNEYYQGLHLELTVLEAPKSGRIIDGENRNLKSFNWNELDQGRVFYEHDGSETRNDSFTIMANASDANHHSQPVTVSVMVQPVNDEKPIVVINSGLQIWEGETAVINPQALLSIDADSSPEELVYTFFPPSNGEVIVREFPGRVSRFTQKDLEQGLVHFMHRGETDGGFFFTVSDGENDSEKHFFRVQATLITVSMKSLNDLIACPRSLQQITSQNLNAGTNEGKDAQPVFVYYIENPPQIGQIIRGRDMEGTVLSNFTQSEVDAGLIFYQHIVTPTPFWTAMDNFSFHVQSPRAVSSRYIMNVTVTFESPCPQLHTQLWKNTGLRILQGGSTPITLNSLDASNLLANPSVSSISHDVVFLVTNFPSQGHLSLYGDTLNSQISYFLQSHLENGSLLYIHTKSGGLDDSFQFTARPWPKSQPFHERDHDVGILVNESFNITFTSSPMIPPIILQPKSTLLLPVGSYVSLTQDHLSLDTTLASPDKIVYTILDLPVGISVETFGSQSMPVTQFTQDDLAKSRIMLMANITAVSGEIRVNVTDGQQTPLIGKLPVKVLPVHQAVLEVKQESGRAKITLGHIPPTLGRMADTFFYKITKKPSYGQVVVGQDTVSEFQWKQVNNNEVSYEFTSFLSTQDEFELLAVSSFGEEVIVGKVTVVVSAMVKIGDRQQWPRGCTIMLGSDVVDASELEKHTNSVPQFIVLRQPRGGKLMKFPYQGSRGEGASTNVFTQLELDSGLIGVELWEDEPSRTDIRSDRLSLMLSASQVPPANVTVRFTTVPYNSSHSYTATLLRVAGHLQTTTNVAIPTTALESTSMMFTTHIHSTNIGSTLASTSSESTTQLETTTQLVSTTDLGKTNNLIPITNSELTTTLEPTTHPDISINTTQPNTFTPDLWVLKDRTWDITMNSSRINASTSPSPAEERTVLAFMNSHIYSIILPVCLVLLLVAVGLLLLAYFVRRKKMGKHHVQKAATSAAKTENGATDRQTFRPTEPERGIPLCEVGGHRGNGVGGNGQPGSQYWV